MTILPFQRLCQYGESGNINLYAIFIFEWYSVKLTMDKLQIELYVLVSVINFQRESKVGCRKGKKGREPN